MSFVEIPGKGPPKNGIFYTIDELKAHGEYNFNLDGQEKTTRKSKDTSPTSSEVATKSSAKPKETVQSSLKTPKTPESKPAKDKKTPSITKTPKSTSTTKDKITKSKKTKLNVSLSDKIEWITKKTKHGFSKIMYHNNQKKTGKTAHKIWAEYKRLQDESKSSAPTNSKTTKPVISAKQTIISDDDSEYSEIEEIPSSEDDDNDTSTELNNSVEILE
jgi:hypothetical protein